MGDLLDELRDLISDCLEPSWNPYRPTDCEFHVDWYDHVKPLKEGLEKAVAELSLLRDEVAELRAENGTLRSRDVKFWHTERKALLAELSLLRDVAEAADKLLRQMTAIERRPLGEVTLANMSATRCPLEAWRARTK